MENKSKEHAVNVFDSASFISKGIKQKLHLKTNLPTFILPLGADIISHTDKDFNCLKLLYMGTLSNRHIIDTVKGVKMFKDKFVFKRSFCLKPLDIKEALSNTLTACSILLFSICCCSSDLCTDNVRISICIFLKGRIFFSQ